MPILSDSGKENIHRFRLEFGPNFYNRPVGIAITVQQVIPCDSGFVNQSLEEIFAKTGWMGGRQADVFVQVKKLDPAPVDVGRPRQRIQEFKLRCPGCGYQAGASLIAQRPPNRACGMVGCYLP